MIDQGAVYVCFTGVAKVEESVDKSIKSFSEIELKISEKLSVSKEWMW